MKKFSKCIKVISSLVIVALLLYVLVYFVAYIITFLILMLALFAVDHSKWF